MKCTLMHKRIAVAKIELDDATGFIQKIGTVYAPEHLPVGIPLRKGMADRTAMNALGYDKIPAQMRSEREVLCKPFKNHHEEQIRLVTSFDWIDFDRLSDVGELIAGVLSAEGASDYMDDYRIQTIVQSVQQRIVNLAQLAQAYRP